MPFSIFLYNKGSDERNVRVTFQVQPGAPCDILLMGGDE